jgi:uncharacterized protein with von Willebrand factor type A (vWA) domain
VEFVDEEQQQDFFAKYGYEPDEQPMNVKEKSIMIIDNLTNWTTFYKTHNQNNVFQLNEDELEELNMEKFHLFHL